VGAILRERRGEEAEVVVSVVWRGIGECCSIV
jgi:hypothetical protein